MQRHHIHMHSEGPIGGEFSLPDLGDQAYDFRPDARSSSRFRHAGKRAPRLLVAPAFSASHRARSPGLKPLINASWPAAIHHMSRSDVPGPVGSAGP
jgi:hypothetical protein